MNNTQKEKEEYLEALWEMRERGITSLSALKEEMDKDFDPQILDELSYQNLIELNACDVNLTKKGEEQARKIIRAHRIGERLLYDVFGGEFEGGACEFEHTVTTSLIDGICTLLGHPRECPHGMPIPEGECCKSCAKSACNAVVPLQDLKIGESAKVAYINCKDDRRMHRLNGIQIRPGAIIKLHQINPCYVVECEGGHIAMDEDIVSNIKVWTNVKTFDEEKKIIDKDKRRLWRNYLKKIK
ncbi:MAG: metal-dependent transcriptional regulator [Desulfobacterales bacterium]|nr:metal-dependent transcriptional regulator [Desulfobacterales bacterium]MBF0396929.1 metal-dependent transcriptional regulator [Desulfobacterales bacterium]